MQDQPVGGCLGCGGEVLKPREVPAGSFVGVLGLFVFRSAVVGYQCGKKH